MINTKQNKTSMYGQGRQGKNKINWNELVEIQLDLLYVRKHKKKVHIIS